MMAVLFTGSVFAQNDDYKSTINVNAGFSLVGGLFNAVATTSGTSNTYALPAIQLNYDKGIEKWFTIGAGVSFQTMGIEYTDYLTSTGATENFKASFNRLNVAFRAMFHYGNGGNVDMYSGLRMGMTNWGVSSDSSDPLYDPETELAASSGFNFSPQLVLFGIRGYFNENLGLNMELAAGSPHFLSIGATYRF